MLTNDDCWCYLALIDLWGSFEPICHVCMCLCSQKNYKIIILYLWSQIYIVCYLQSSCLRLATTESLQSVSLQSSFIVDLFVIHVITYIRFTRDLIYYIPLSLVQKGHKVRMRPRPFGASSAQKWLLCQRLSPKSVRQIKKSPPPCPFGLLV